MIGHKGIDAIFGDFFPSPKHPVMHDRKGPVVVGILTSKGGAAKSTVAFHLAIELTRYRKKCLIIDTDAKQKTVTQAMLNRARCHPRLLREKGPAFRRDDPAKVRDRIAWAAKNHFDFVVLDVAGRDGSNLGTLVSLSSLVLIPSQPNEEDLREARKIIRRARVQAVPNFLLLTRVVNEHAAWVKENIETFCKGAKRAPCAIHQSTIFPQLFRSGRGVTETKSKIRPAEDFRSLGAFVIAQTRKKKDASHAKSKGT